MHRVVVPFPCSWDGITAVSLVEGDVRDFGTMAAGLVGMGWIEPISVDAAASEDTPPTETAEFAVVVDEPFEMAVDEPEEIEVAVEAPRRVRKRK